MGVTSPCQPIIVGKMDVTLISEQGESSRRLPRCSNPVDASKPSSNLLFINALEAGTTVENNATNFMFQYREGFPGRIRRRDHCYGFTARFFVADKQDEAWVKAGKS